MLTKQGKCRSLTKFILTLIQFLRHGRRIFGLQLPIPNTSFQSFHLQDIELDEFLQKIGETCPRFTAACSMLRKRVTQITSCSMFHHAFSRLARKYQTSFESGSHTLLQPFPGWYLRDFAIDFVYSRSSSLLYIHRTLCQITSLFLRIIYHASFYFDEQDKSQFKRVRKILRMFLVIKFYAYLFFIRSSQLTINAVEL